MCVWVSACVCVLEDGFAAPHTQQYESAHIYVCELLLCLKVAAVIYVLLLSLLLCFGCVSDYKTIDVASPRHVIDRQTLIAHAIQREQSFTRERYKIEVVKPLANLNH